ncbi:MAG: rRNA maturation RNase YbeY [Legionellales bacterium]|nr:rRNA maturation RNase YbeY [Legionellales bacterium]|tara:strand:+ start:135 stop:575 length:441 start_codon:yes stop_codon:yes gene_type:complete
MTSNCVVNRVTDSDIGLSDQDIDRLIDLVASHQHVPVEHIEISLVDNAEMQRLNHQFRQLDKPTNVLSFPQETNPVFGDIIIAVPYATQEALSLDRSLSQHFSHLLVHGFLHLCGLDHVDEVAADEMETVEIHVLKQLGIPNPYED